MAAAGTKRQGRAVHERDSRENAKAVVVKAERSRWYDNNECFVCGKQGHKQWDCPQSQQGKAGKGVHGQSHDQTPTQQQQSINGPAQHTRSKTTGMAPASATPRASGYQTASKAVVTEAEPAAPEASTQNDEDYVYIRVSREKMVPVDDGLTETVQHQVSHSAGPQNAAPILHTVPVQAATTSQQWRGDSSTINSVRAAVLQPGRCGETIVNSVENKPRVGVLTQHLAGRLAVPGAVAAAEIKVLMDSGSSITAMLEKLVQALRGQVGMAQTALTQAFVGFARVVTLLGQECDIETQSYPLHLTIDAPWGPVRFTMPFIVLPGRGDVVIIGQKTLRETSGTDVMAQLKASVPKAQGCQDGAGMELTARSVGEPNDGAVLRATMAVTAFVPGGHAPGDVDDDFALTLPSQRPTIFQDSEVEMRDRAGVLETVADNAVDHGFPPECAKMLRDILLRTHLDVLCRALPGVSPARKKPGAVRFH